MRGTETLRKRLACIHDEQTRPRCGVVLVHPDGCRTWNDGADFDPDTSGSVIEVPAPMEEREWQALVMEQQAELMRSERP